MKLILASTSRYRRELLERLRVPFDCEPPGVDEQALPGERPRALSHRLATEKAQAVAQRHPDALVIGSDQAASLDGASIIGKPGSHERAVEQLRAASGQTLMFHTSMAVLQQSSGFADSITIDTRVRFRRLSDLDIETYLRAEQPYDCAGAAKCEGLGISLLEAIEGGDPTALIGLPLIALCTMLRAAGLTVPASGVRA